MNIGEKIKLLRKEKGLTQKELAELIGVSTITIQNYENNRRQPNIDTINKLGSALGVFFFSFEDEDTTKHPKDNQNYLIDKYLETLNCQFIYDEEDGYLIFKSPDGEFEISQNDIDEFNNSIRSFVQFKISEIIKKSRKIGK